MPIQDLGGIRQRIVHRLDEAAMRCPSSIAWDRFTFPQTDPEFCREEALCDHPGKTLDVRACMTGFQLMLQDDKGKYAHSGHALIFEGSRLVYKPQCNIGQWVPVQGTSAALMMSELCTANDLANMVPPPSVM